MINNKIIQRIAAYIDKNGNKNYDIDQEISTNYVNGFIDSPIAILRLTVTKDKDPLGFAFSQSKYLIIDGIGLCGISFTNSKNEKIVIEFHVSQLTQESITNINIRFNRAIRKRNYIEQDELSTIFKNKLYNEYYIGIILVYKNDILVEHYLKCYHKSQLPELKNIGNRLVQQYKNKYQ